VDLIVFLCHEDWNFYQASKSSLTELPACSI
jgi:hypothetical protein